MKKINGWLYAFWIALIVILIMALAVGLIAWAGSGAEESADGGDGEGGGDVVKTYDNTQSFEAEDAALFNSMSSSTSTSSISLIGTEETTLTDGTVITNVKNFNTVGDKIVFQVLASAAIENVTIDVTACCAMLALFSEQTFADNDKILTVNGGNPIALSGTLTNPSGSFSYNNYGTLTGTISLNAGINYIEITAASTNTSGYLNVDKIDLSWDGTATIAAVNDYTGDVFAVDSTGVATMEAEDASLMNAVGATVDSLNTNLLGTEVSSSTGVTQVKNFNLVGDEIVFQVNATAAVTNATFEAYVYPSTANFDVTEHEGFIKVNGQNATMTNTSALSRGSYGAITAMISLDAGINYIEIVCDSTGYSSTLGMNLGFMNVDRIDLNGGTYKEPATEVSNADDLVVALEDGGNIVLSDNIEDIEETLEVSKDTTLDLSSNTLSSTTGEILTVSDGATLTITDSGEGGSIAYSYVGEANAAGAAWNTSTNYGEAVKVEEGGSLVLESGTISSSSVGIRAEAVSSDSTGKDAITISGGTIESEYYTIWASGDVDITVSGGTIAGTSKGLFVAGDDKFGYDGVQSGTTTLTITGGTISCEKDSAICTIGNTSGDHKVINISGGKIIGPDLVDETTGEVTCMPAIYNASGNLTITGGTITGSTAVEHRGGELTISGGTLVCNATGTQNTPAYAKSGATSYGFALAIYPFDHATSVAWNKTMVVSITGGTFTGDIYVADNVLNGVDASGNTVTASISISGVTVYGDIILAASSTLNLSEIVGENVMTNSTRVTGSADTDHSYVLGEDDTEFNGSVVTATYDATTGTYTLAGTAGILTEEQDMAFDGDSTHIGKAYFCFTVNVLDGEYATFEAFSDTAESTSAGTWVLDNTNGTVSITGFDDADETNGAFILGVKSDGETSEWHMNVTVYDASGTAVVSFTIAYTVPTATESSITS